MQNSQFLGCRTMRYCGDAYFVLALLGDYNTEIYHAKEKVFIVDLGAPPLWARLGFKAKGVLKRHFLGHRMSVSVDSRDDKNRLQTQLSGLINFRDAKEDET